MFHMNFLRRNRHRLRFFETQTKLDQRRKQVYGNYYETIISKKIENTSGVKNHAFDKQIVSCAGIIGVSGDYHHRRRHRK